MELQNIVGGLSIIAIGCLMLAIVCFVGIGLTIHERDRRFEQSKLEYKQRMEDLGQKPY